MAEPERPGALALMRRLDTAGRLLSLRRLRRVARRLARRSVWPVYPGAYVVGDPAASVAVCTLSDAALVANVAQLPRVAMAGRVSTANLGVERIVGNMVSNPNIRFLLLCGRDSPLFHPGDALVALAANGVDEQRRIRGTTGYMPLLTGLPVGAIESFRRQVEVVDRRESTDLDELRAMVAELAERDPGPLRDAGPVARSAGEFAVIKPGGRRRDPIGYDPVGYFVVSVDRRDTKIVVEHYRADHAAAHRMRGSGAEAILAGLLREGLVTQLDHAGYLGAELAKAESAMRLGLRYEQDKPLRAGALERGHG